MKTDTSLIRIIHTEQLDTEHRLHVMLTRFGGLAVFIDRCWDTLYQGNNILEAREWFQDQKESCSCTGL